MRLRFERAARLELLPDSAHCRHAKTKIPRNLAGAFALFIEEDDSPARRQRDRSHGSDPAKFSRPSQATLFVEML